jgi:hypothetical protein
MENNNSNYNFDIIDSMYMILPTHYHIIPGNNCIHFCGLTNITNAPILHPNFSTEWLSHFNNFRLLANMQTTLQLLRAHHSTRRNLLQLKKFQPKKLRTRNPTKQIPRKSSLRTHPLHLLTMKSTTMKLITTQKSFFMTMIQILLLALIQLLLMTLRFYHCSNHQTP